MDQFYLNYVHSLTIESNTISDHAPISLTVCLVLAGIVERKCGLNESILDDTLAMESLSCTLASYFEMNNPEDVYDQALWEAHKAVIRRELIS